MGVGKDCVEGQGRALRKAIQGNLIGRDPILHLMFNQSLDVFCCLLDANFILSGSGLSPIKSNQGGISIFMVYVTGFLGKWGPMLMT